MQEGNFVTHHFTRNTVEAQHWCPKCKAFTMHRVDRDKMQGRLGPCIPCMERHDSQPKESKPEAAKQERLFA